MKKLFIFSCIIMLAILISCSEELPRISADFNYGWKFHLGEVSGASECAFDDSAWKTLNLPHDWGIELGYSQDHTAASTGFIPGGIGWYRKSFRLPEKDKNKYVNIEFDGIYNRSKIWINGTFLGGRPYGFSSFSFDLTGHLYFDGRENVIAVRVDRTRFADARWYTGSGIYRNVRLVKTGLLHVKPWGLQISTPKVSAAEATVTIKTSLENAGSSINIAELKYSIIDPEGSVAASQNQTINLAESNTPEITINVKSPMLWNLVNPKLYCAKVEIYSQEKKIDNYWAYFGIRTINFDANKGFSLNGERIKLKGVNMHHDAGCLGAAVPKDIWEYRVKKLKLVGANAIRMAHNPHSPELLEVCDEQGMLVLNEIFDEWDRPKKKSLVYLGDNAATLNISHSYSEVFQQWAEQDVKDWVLRDFNHPSVIMLSIGNEIEWAFPNYTKTFGAIDKGEESPQYDSLILKNEFDKNSGAIDTLALIAKKLSGWIKEIDTTRPVTCGNVMPSIGLASGYANAVDVLGFNYRAQEYAPAHKTYPSLKILGSENKGAYFEWKSCADKDYVAGIFIWTGFAYLGEAGPWPRKGLNISLFDFAGFKNPRGHFFECLWKDDPKVYLVTCPLKGSEYSYNQQKGWVFTMQYTPPPVWKALREWEWYITYPKWKYAINDSIIVQAYTNCQEAELFLNGTSFGKKLLAEFADDNIIKWLVPYKPGELMVIGYNNGVQAADYSLKTHGSLAKISLETDKVLLKADGYSATVITASLLDEYSNLITDSDQEISFAIGGPIKNIGVDNGWEYNILPHKTNTIKTHEGRAIIVVQSVSQKGKAHITAASGQIISNEISMTVK